MDTRRGFEHPASLLIVCCPALVSSSAGLSTAHQQQLFQTSLIVSVPVARCLSDEMEGRKSDKD